MSTKEEVSPTRKTDKCIKDFQDSKELITEEDSEEDIEEMSKSLADLKAGQEDNDNDSTLNTNKMEEVGVDEEVNMLEVDIVEKEVFVTVDVSEVDPLETGEDHEILEKCARRKKLEKLKGEIERVKLNLKAGEEKEPDDDDSKGGKKPNKREVPYHRFRPGPYPGARKFPGVQSPPKIKEPVEIKEPLETDAEGNNLQSVESKKPFPMWPEAVGGAVEAARKARKEKLRQFRVMRALRRYRLPTETAHEHEEEVFSALPDEGKVANVEEEATADVEKIKADRCSGRDCKKKIGLTGFACRCRLVFCPLHR